MKADRRSFFKGILGSTVAIAVAKELPAASAPLPALPIVKPTIPMTGLVCCSTASAFYTSPLVFRTQADALCDFDTEWERLREACGK